MVSQSASDQAPASEEAVSEALAAADADRRGLTPRGAATKASFGGDTTTAERLDLRRLDQLVAYEPGDFVCIAQAGMPLDDLNQRLAADRQRLMLDPPYGPDQTLGGVVATNVSGPLRHRYGAPRDLVLGLRFVLADGTIARSGGRVVKNVAGYDLTRLLCGSLGALAVITEVAFRLHPLPAATTTTSLSTRDASRAAAFAASIRAAGLTPDTLEIEWPAGRVEARFSGGDEAAEAQARRAATLDAAATTDADAPAPLPPPAAAGEVVVGVGVPLTRVVALLDLAERHCQRLALRAGFGVGEAHLASDQLPAFRDAVTGLGGYVTARRGCRIPPTSDPVRLALARRVKDRLDPHRTLSPGRDWC
jgi:glycolate oxidase FAD binding subunit